MRERQDRLAELEGKVRELEATVLGMTEELVEANERIRDLETELADSTAGGRQAELGRTAAGRATGGGAAKNGRDASVTAEGRTTYVDEESAESDGQAAEAGAQKPMSDDPEEQSDTRESDDDIIIA